MKTVFEHMIRICYDNHEIRKLIMDGVKKQNIEKRNIEKRRG